jgi:hypothetical protein
MKNNSKNNYCFPSEFTAARLEAGFSVLAVAKNSMPDNTHYHELVVRPATCPGVGATHRDSRKLVYGRPLWLQTRKGAREGFAMD